MRDAVSEAHARWTREGWTDAADGMAAVLELIRVHRILMDRIDRCLRPLRLTFARYEIIMLLSFTRRGALSIGGLGRLLQVHATSVTSAVDRLQEDGLVERVRGDADRRVVMARITPEGRRVASAATDRLNQDVFAALGLSEAQGQRLWMLLRAFRANAGDFRAAPGRARRTG